MNLSPDKQQAARAFIEEQARPLERALPAQTQRAGLEAQRAQGSAHRLRNPLLAEDHVGPQRQTSGRQRRALQKPTA